MSVTVTITFANISSDADITATILNNDCKPPDGTESAEWRINSGVASPINPFGNERSKPFSEGLVDNTMSEPETLDIRQQIAQIAATMPVTPTSESEGMFVTASASSNNSLSVRERIVGIASTLTAVSSAQEAAPRAQGAPRAQQSVSALTAGDVYNITIVNASFSFNGTRAAIGRGSGVFLGGRNVDKIQSSNLIANENNDYGFAVLGGDEIRDVVLTDGIFNGNDKNLDDVGDGVLVSGSEDVEDVRISNVTANDNAYGIRVITESPEHANGIELMSNTASGNKEGIVVRSSRDLSNVMIDGNSLSNNDFGIVLDATEDGRNLYVSNNRVTGNNGEGVGLHLMANNAMIESNVIRGNRVGVQVEKVYNNEITGNNIVSNDGFGVRVVGNAQGQEVEAPNNWWGEPSGPKSDDNPNGIGDRAGDGVMYEPFLKEPAVTTRADFQISNVSVPNEGRAGQPVEVSFTVKNTGPEEGTQVINISVSNSQDIQVSNAIHTRTLNPAAETDVSVPMTFTFGGTYLITISTDNDSSEHTIDVSGPSASLSVETAIDVNGNRMIDDAEIMFAVNSWVTQQPMEIGNNLIVDDEMMKRLVILWATGERYSLGVEQHETEAQPTKKKQWWEEVLEWFGVK